MGVQIQVTGARKGQKAAQPALEPDGREERTRRLTAIVRQT